MQFSMVTPECKLKSGGVSLMLLLLTNWLLQRELLWVRGRDRCVARGLRNASFNRLSVGNIAVFERDAVIEEVVFWFDACIQGCNLCCMEARWYRQCCKI